MSPRTRRHNREVGADGGVPAACAAAMEWVLAERDPNEAEVVARLEATREELHHLVTKLGLPLRHPKVQECSRRLDALVIQYYELTRQLPPASK